MKPASIVLALVFATLVIAGCATPAPNYSISIPHVEKLKSSGAGPVAVAPVTAQGSEANDEAIAVRASRMVSPYGSFAKYLQSALTQELTEARLLDPQSGVQLTATLLKNDVSAAGVITASATIEARFVVRKSGTVVFDKVKNATITWDSNFIGAIAIPRAIENYPRLVSALLDQLYADDQFFAAIRK